MDRTSDIVHTSNANRPEIHDPDGSFHTRSVILVRLCTKSLICVRDFSIMLVWNASNHPTAMNNMIGHQAI